MRDVKLQISFVKTIDSTNFVYLDSWFLWIDHHNIFHIFNVMIAQIQYSIDEHQKLIFQDVVQSFKVCKLKSQRPIPSLLLNKLKKSSRMYNEFAA